MVQLQLPYVLSSLKIQIQFFNFHAGQLLKIQNGITKLMLLYKNKNSARSTTGCEIRNPPTLTFWSDIVRTELSHIKYTDTTCSASFTNHL